MRGGPSQLETFDMKPKAPVEIRGEFKPISTNVAGNQICELLPLTAKVMDKFSVVRSLRHPKQYGDVSHSRGDQVVFTGYPRECMPKENPKYPQDVLATIYRHLGVDITTKYIDHNGRPHPVLPFGQPIEELF